MILLSLLAATAAAQQPQPTASPPSPAPEEITVTGRVSTEQDRKDFVRALTTLSFNGQIARFEHRVCPIAIGLPPVQAEAIAARLRTLAHGIGLAVAPRGCPANIVVAVTASKKAFIDELRRNHGDWFGDLSQADIRAIAKQPGPASAWQLQGPPVSARGTELAFDEGMGTYVNRTTESASRMTAGARPQFEGAVVVVERAVLDGLTVTQLADYAAMRAFAATDPNRVAQSATPTILHVLDAPMDSVVPGSLTSWDLAFLRSLYAAPRNLPPDAQRSAIRKGMEGGIKKR